MLEGEGVAVGLGVSEWVREGALVLVMEQVLVLLSVEVPVLELVPVAVDVVDLLPERVGVPDGVSVLLAVDNGVLWHHDAEGAGFPRSQKRYTGIGTSVGRH